MIKGFIKLYRSLYNNPLISKPDYLAVWIYLLLKANHSENFIIHDNKKIVLQPGQAIIGRKQIAQKTRISESKVYRILKYLENEQQIEQQTNNKFTLISILNWEKYQGNGVIIEQQTEQPVNNQRTTSEQPVNTYKNDKNVKNDNNDKNAYIKKEIYKEKKIKHLDFVYLAEAEYQKLLDEYGEKKTRHMIDKLNDYIGSKGKRYKSHYFTIRNWIRMDEDKKENAKSEPTFIYKKI